jgi:hypothetical protein
MELEVKMLNSIPEQDLQDFYDKIKYYSQRYRIPYFDNGQRLNYEQLLNKIKQYEVRHQAKLVHIRKNKYREHFLFKL